jgi:hypothetical protein
VAEKLQKTLYVVDTVPDYVDIDSGLMDLLEVYQSQALDSKLMKATNISQRAHKVWADMAVLGRVGTVVILGILTLLVGTFAGNVAEEVYEESGITYEEGHPTAYGGVHGWSPVKSLEVVAKIALGYLEDLLKIGK